MVLSLGVGLVVVGLIFFALRGFLGDFPDEWEWAGFVLGGSGVAMTTPSLFQMFFGRPTLKVDFVSETSKGERLLHVYLRNPPVTSRLLRTLGVQRETIQSLQVTGRIKESGSGKILLPAFQALLLTDEDIDPHLRKRISLPPTYSIGATAGVAKWDDKKKKAVLISDTKSLELERGQYRAELIFLKNGDPIPINRNFVVGQTVDDLSWIEPPKEKPHAVKS